MVRGSLIAAVLTPAIVILLWGDTLALSLGSASDGFQANYYPPPAASASAHHVQVLETSRIVPSDGLPSGVEVLTANNNLDATRHSDGRVYLAWRTAPDHFAGADTVIQVVSSTDERSWRFEQRAALRTDLREPRLLSLNGSLFLYLSELGSNRWTQPLMSAYLGGEAMYRFNGEPVRGDLLTTTNGREWKDQTGFGSKVCSAKPGRLSSLVEVCARLT